MISIPKQGNEIQRAIDSLSASYQAISKNETLRRELSRSSLSPSTWREIDALFSTGIGSSPDFFVVYQGIASMLELTKILATEVRQSVRGRLTGARRQVIGGANAILEMTASNLDSNVRILLERLSELYSAAGREDGARNGQARRIVTRFPELSDPATWAVGT